MSAWGAIAGVAIGTYALRASMLLLLGRRALPSWTDVPMALVGPAALAALVASLVVAPHGTVDPAPVAELAAVGAGFAAVRRSGKVAHAFAVGLPVFWLVSWCAG